MDGFAVRAVDTVDADRDSPVRLSISQTIPAGTSADSASSEPNEAAKIMTGAPIPEGADSVVQVEVDRGEGRRRAHLRAGQAGQEHPQGR